MTWNEFDGKTDHELRRMIEQINDELKQLHYDRSLMDDEDFENDIGGMYFISDLEERRDTIKKELELRQLKQELDDL